MLLAIVCLHFTQHDSSCQYISAFGLETWKRMQHTKHFENDKAATNVLCLSKGSNDLIINPNSKCLQCIEDAPEMLNVRSSTLWLESGMSW